MEWMTAIAGDFMPPYGFMDDARISNIPELYLPGWKIMSVQPFTDREVVETGKAANNRRTGIWSISFD